MKLVITRETDNHPFYSFVFEDKMQAERDIHRGAESVVKTTKAFGGPDDGWMITTPFGWREEAIGEFI